MGKRGVVRLDPLHPHLYRGLCLLLPLLVKSSIRYVNTVGTKMIDPHSILIMLSLSVCHILGHGILAPEFRVIQQIHMVCSLLYIVLVP